MSTDTATWYTCVRCGAPVLETPDDPAPGICPRCLDAALATIEGWVRRRVEEFPTGVSPAWLRDALIREAGVRPDVAAEQVGWLLARVADRRRQEGQPQ